MVGRHAEQSALRVAFFGLGKMGLPISVAMARSGHSVLGYEIDPEKRRRYRSGVSELYEPGLDRFLRIALTKGLRIVDSPEEAIRGARIVFVAVPTPSLPTKAFDNRYVVKAMRTIGSSIADAKDYRVISLMSTVLPGTTREQIAPALEQSSGKTIGNDVGLCYNASFVAMGSVMSDFVSPEFVLVGESDRRAGRTLEAFFKPIVRRSVPVVHMTWENAEIVKMAYNSYIGFKIVLSNTLMEIAHQLPTGDVDMISRAMMLADKRIAGPGYLKGGLGDSGPCHPRDAEALSWFAGEHGLSVDPYDFVMFARKKQAEWIASLLRKYKLPIVIMGARYKPNTNLTDYSNSLLIRDILVDARERVTVYDPLAKFGSSPPRSRNVYLLATDADFIHSFDYERDSVVLDVWRCLSRREVRDLEQKGVQYVAVGKGPNPR